MITFINNQFLPEEKAVIKVADLAIQRGYAIFDFFRTKNNVPLFIDDYLNRFCNSAAMLGLPIIYSRSEIKNFIHEMIRHNNIPQSGFRMILTGGYSPDSYEPDNPNFIIIQQPIQLPAEAKFEAGLKVILHDYVRDLPTIKSTHYLMGIWLRNEIRAKQADDVLYHNKNFILEFPRSNVFMVTKENVVVTPSENMLLGVTRKKVLELANKRYTTEERGITLRELKDAKEVFLTSTTKRIIPVVKLDEALVGNGEPGEVTRHLYKEFLEMEDAWFQDFPSLA